MKHYLSAIAVTGLCFMLGAAPEAAARPAPDAQQPAAASYSLTDYETAENALDAGLSTIRQHITDNALTDRDRAISNALNQEIPALLNTIKTDLDEIRQKFDDAVMKLTKLVVENQTAYPSPNMQVAAEIMRQRVIYNVMEEDDYLKRRGQTPLLTPAARQALQKANEEEITSALDTLLNQMLAEPTPEEQAEAEAQMQEWTEEMNKTPTPQEQQERLELLRQLLPPEMIQQMQEELGQDILEKMSKMSMQEIMDFLMEQMQKQQSSKDQSFHFRRQHEQRAIYEGLSDLRA